MFLIAILFTIIQEIMCSWQYQGSYGLSLPAHTYYVQCEENYALSGTVSWTDNNKNTLRLYIYESGSDLTSTEYIDNYMKQGVIIFYRSDLSGDYYIRIQAISMQSQFVTYTLSVTSYNTNLYKQGSFYKGSGLGRKSALLIQSNTYPQSLPLRYTATQQLSTVVVYNSITQQSYNLQNGVSICLPASTPTWYLVVKDTVYQAETTTQYTLNIEYNNDLSECYCSPDLFWNTLTNMCQKNCAQGQKWNSATSQCQTAATFTPETTPIGLIVGIAAGGVVLIVLVVALIYYFRCRSKENQYESGNGNQTPEGVIQTNSNLQIDDTVVCSICLDTNCNTILPCKHCYHLSCIKSWMGKNKHCPLCRNAFSASKIQNKSSF